MSDAKSGAVTVPIKVSGRRFWFAARVAITMVAVSGLLACAPTQPRSSGSDSSSESTTSEVVVAAASDLRFALDDVIAATVESHPHLRFRVTYGSSGQFLQQIQAGAPFDLYLSADSDYPRSLVAAGWGSSEDFFIYAFGRLALWLPEGSPLSAADGLVVLTDERVRRIAIANPQHAPYGRAAIDALTTADILTEVDTKFALGENVAQAAEFVASGNADAGIVAMSLVLSKPLADIGRWSEVPQSYFRPLEQGGLILTTNRGAQVLRDVLLNETGREILTRYGFIE